MKLIDMLVEELPKRGGWPDDSDEMCQSQFDCEIYTNSKLLSDFYVGERAEDNGIDNGVTREQYEAALAYKNDGWIGWGGGECPVEEGTRVDVRYRNGEENHHIRSGISFCDTGSNPDFNAGDWDNDGNSLDIIAYRLHQPQKAEQAEADGQADLNECIGKAPSAAWKGEWLPSAGCECEYQYKVHGSEWCSFECVAVDGNAAFGWGNNTPIALQLNTHNFRPMRTEAERAIDEMVRLSGVSIGAAKILYDAGYRK